MAGLFACFILALTGGVVCGGPTYFITSPSEITRGVPYKLSVDILNGTNVEVTAILKKSFYDGKQRRHIDQEIKEVKGVFSKGHSGFLSFPIEEDFNCRGCKLLIQGRGSQVFERTHHISVEQSIVSIFIQTDKAIYKPGQTVRYRAFAVYHNLQVYKGIFNINIKDPSSNKIMVKNGLSSASGVVEGSINLSDQPPFGDWSIEASLEDMPETKTQSFTVAQYELPRFEVTVDLAPFALVSETKVTGTVKAKYTFGKPVKGMVDLHVGPDRGPDICGRLPKSVNIGFEIDGEASFSVPKSSIQRVVSIYNNVRVRVTAYVTEATTGVKLNGTNSLQFYTQQYTISAMSNTPSVFKPGLPYKAYVQVKSQDGMPPSEDGKNILKVYPYATYKTTVDDQNKYGVSSFTGTYALEKLEIAIPANGIVPIIFDIPKNATNIAFQAYFKDIFVRKDVEKAFSPSNNYVQLTMKSSDIKSGDKASFKIQATEPLDLVSCEIVSRGGVSKRLTLKGNGKSSISFTVDITPSMGPVSNLLTYYIRKDSEIVADSIAFNVDGIFENEVSVDFNKEKAEPNANVQLKVKADPKSNVFLLAVDQSVLLLKSGNDVSPSKIENEVSKQKALDSEFALSRSAASVGSVFTQSGLIYITDAKMTRPLIPRKRFNGGARPYARGRNYYSLAEESFEMEEEALEMSPANFKVQSVKRIRNFFPEAWLWQATDVGADGTAIVNTTVPDTITTWITSAFATNPETGLGVAGIKTNLTVFRSFFVSLTYPRIMKRNEKAVIQATVFNYLSDYMKVQVTMTSKAGFQFIEVNSDGTERVMQNIPPQIIKVKSNTQGVVYFPILAKDIGVFDIEVKAQSPRAADGVRRQIVIEPEGAPASYNIPIFIDKRSKSGSYNKRHSFTFPESTIQGSEKVSVGVSGDLIGPSLDNIDSLLSIPVGCGEQNMVKFAPNLYIGKYLESSGQMSKTLNEKIRDNLFQGYQRQLSYRRFDGSFSAFGNADESGSTWLTAFVSRTLSEARNMIYIDPNVLTRAVDWLVERQRDDGAFVELGTVIDPNTQGKGTGPALTAFSLLTLLQNKDLISLKKCEESHTNCHRTYKWNNATIKAVKNLERSLDSIKDPFPLSVVTYALIKAKSTKYRRAFYKLRRMSISQGGLLFWNDTAKSVSSPAPKYSIWPPPHVPSRPINILTTSYGLLSYTEYGWLRSGLSIVKWLTKQRNSLGGFSSTQDTTVALQALSTFASRSRARKTKLSVNFQGAEENLRFRLNKNNLLNLQTKEFQTLAVNKNELTFDVDVKALGKGIALAEIDFSFHTNSVPPSKSFDMSAVLLDDELDSFNLMICTKWLKEGKSGMVVQEIEIPSGFEPDLTTIGNVVGMKRYERKGNVAAVYFDEIVKTSTCYSILMTRKAKIAKSERSFVHTFSYYNPEDKGTIFYHPRKLRDATICDVCDRCCI